MQLELEWVLRHGEELFLRYAVRSMSGDVLQRAAELAAAWLESLPERPVRAAGEPDGLRGPLPEEGEDAVAVIEALAAAAEPGLVGERRAALLRLRHRRRAARRGRRRTG